ncbi:MAG: adenosylcobinamide-GDP ribazoletransferase [Granulosicoccus sp.]|jgi:adenosylcobinamide-GDP ribazoletransferase
MLMSRLIEEQLIAFGTALMFLTRLPVGRFCSGDALVLSVSTRYFPLVGAFVGLLLSTFLIIAHQWLPANVTVVLMLIIGVRLTGAFHEDGLADVADSAGAFDIDRKLEIMRDSRVGTYGALALILLVLGKFLVLTELLFINVSYSVAALVCAHILSRWSSVWLMATEQYARPEAANKVVADGVTQKRLIESTVVTILLLVPLVWVSSLAIFALVPIAWITTLICAQRFKKAFGGITGDCLGAANQVVEFVVLVSVLAYLQ